ncbi:MAG: DNA replication protein [Rhodobiaceae bacterium]|nr:DNA replication protein [Rhodobiaceae bacterium]
MTPRRMAQPRPVGLHLPGAEGEPPVIANGRDNPLVWLRTRRGKDGKPLIDDAEFEAGCRLARDFALAGHVVFAQAGFDGAGSSGRRKTGGRRGGSVSDTTLDARQRYRRAMDTVGDRFASVLEDVCCRETGLGALEAKHGWPPRSAKVVLQMALSALARHYRLA